MGDNSCVIHRQSISDLCKMQAAYLSKLIYEKPQGHMPFDTCWPEEIDKAREHWDEWKDFNHQSENGFVARLYKPKGYNPNAENGDEMCWPTLVFRGTDFDDFRGLGFHIRIRIDALAHLIEDIKARTARGLGNFFGIMSNRGWPILGQPITPRQDEEIVQKRIEKALAQSGNSVLLEQTVIMDADFLATHQEDYTRADAIAAGFKVQPDLSFTLNGPIGGLLAGEAEIKVEILVNTKDKTGDWINNLLQGIGDIENSSQYRYAMRFTKEVMQKYISKSHDKRLTITGHSLGGGLATAADFTARYNYYKDNINFYTLVFNPAGLHQGTIRFIKEDSEYAKDVKQAHEEALKRVNENDEDFDKRVKETLKRNKERAKNCIPSPRLGDGNYNVYRVKDEILTTLEYTPHHIPFLQGMMDILGQRFPKPQGADNPMPALSPGLTTKQQAAKQAMVGSMGFYAPKTLQGFVPPTKKLEPAPVLFPLDAQEFPHILALSAIFAKYGKDIRKEKQWPSAMLKGYSAFSHCLNEMVDYIDEALFKGNLKSYIESKGEDRNVLSLVPGGLRGVKLYLSGEISKLQRLMAISAEYHGMDYAIAAMQGKKRK